VLHAIARQAKAAISALVYKARELLHVPGRETADEFFRTFAQRAAWGEQQLIGSAQLVDRLT
jgi:hypothetical protein